MYITDAAVTEVTLHIAVPMHSNVNTTKTLANLWLHNRKLVNQIGYVTTGATGLECQLNIIKSNSVTFIQSTFHRHISKLIPSNNC